MGFIYSVIGKEKCRNALDIRLVKIASSSVKKRTPRNDDCVVLRVLDMGSWRHCRQLPVSNTSACSDRHC